MTRTTRIKKRLGSSQGLLGTLILISSVSTIIISSLFFPEKLSSSVADGLRLAVGKIIPVIFPSLILSDLAVHFGRGSYLNVLSTPASKICGVKSGCAGILFFGLIAGFPTGAKMSYDAYKNGIIEKRECERMMALANNPSLPFVIGVIGGMFLESTHLGAFLYLGMIFGVILSAHLTDKKRHTTDFKQFIPRQSYSFVDSVKKAAEISINVTAFIATFSMITKIITSVINSEQLILIAVSFLELTSASEHISDLCTVSLYFKILLVGFSIGFSGLCAILQSFAVISKNDDISLKRILIFKLVQGICTALVSLLLLFLFI